MRSDDTKKGGMCHCRIVRLHKNGQGAREERPHVAV